MIHQHQIYGCYCVDALVQRYDGCGLSILIHQKIDSFVRFDCGRMNAC